MVVIGIDPGTARTGFGLVREAAPNQVVLVHYGVISTPAKSPLSARLVAIHEELQAILDEHSPESAAVEKLYFQKNVSTAMSVGQARGVILLALAQYGLEVEEYSPQDVKIALTGYGGAEKQQMQKMVQTLLNMDSQPSPDDAADALAVAICHLHTMRTLQRRESAE
jgi:crossover junction endodeoxyribonuclease RuvC